MAEKFSSVWTRPPRPARTSGLGREQIVAAALELLDAEGLEALSMRKLGAKLHAGATSLYWHVANKNDLLELVLDEFWGYVEVPDPERKPWREVITTFVYSLRVTMLEHRWVAGLIGQMPMVGPKAFELSDRLRRAFVQAGFTGLDIYLASGMVMSFVLGQVLPEISLKRVSDGPEWDYDNAMTTLERVAPDYPEMLRDYREYMPTDPATARMVAYDFGLLCVLDGLEARLRTAQSQEPARETR